jgi:hypothetical protein
MSLINGLGPVTATGRLSGRASGRAEASGFTVPEDTRAASLGAAAATEVSLAGLLALQAEAAEDVPDRAARRRARDILTELDRLRHALLRDGIDPAQLLGLAGLIADLPVATDSRLRAVMDQIALRAQVELARHGLV